MPVLALVMVVGIYIIPPVWSEVKGAYDIFATFKLVNLVGEDPIPWI